MGQQLYNGVYQKCVSCSTNLVGNSQNLTFEDIKPLSRTRQQVILITDDYDRGATQCHQFIVLHLAEAYVWTDPEAESCLSRIGTFGCHHCKSSLLCGKIEDDLLLTSVKSSALISTMIR